MEKMLGNLRKRLAYQEMDLQLEPAASEWIAENGYDPIYGARPLMRFITRELETPLAKQIIAGNIMPNSLITAKLVDGKLEFQSTEKE